MKTQTPLLPHQSAFVETVLRPDGPPLIVLSAPAGMGKTMALAALAAEALQQNPLAKVLLLVPTSTEVMAAARRLNGFGAAAEALDRFRFRELMDTAHDNVPWPAGKVTVATQEFVSEADVSDALGRAHWALIIVDNPEPRFRLAVCVSKATAKTVIATSLVIGYDDQATVVKWDARDLVDFEGRPVPSGPPLAVIEVPYDFSDQGVELLKGLREFEHHATDLVPEASRLARELVGAALSGPSEYDTELFAAAAGGPEQTGQFDPGVALKQWVSEQARVRGLTEATLRQLLERLDRLVTLSLAFLDGPDPKTDTLVDFVRSWLQKGPVGRLLIVSDSAPTFHMFAAELDAHGFLVFWFDGESVTDRLGLDPISLAENPHGVVTCEMAAVPAAFGTMRVSDVLLYDIPKTDMQVTEAFGAASRAVLGSRGVSIHLMVPVNAGDPEVERRTARFRQLVGASLLQREPE